MSAKETPGAQILDLKDISNEYWREYVFFDENGTQLKIRLDEPTKLYVSQNGSHRVLTSDGISHYIPVGWKHLLWQVKPGFAYFEF